MSATPPRLPAEGQVCGLFGVDIVGFTSAQRDDNIRLYLHRELYEILQAAFGGAGLPWQDSPTEDRGDGALIVIPPALPPARVIDPLPERLRSLIRRHNRVFSQPARIQLRAAFHMGPVHYDNHGYVGTDIDILFRLLDAAPLRRALASSGAELGLITSSYVHDNLVRRHPTLIDPAAFQKVSVRIKRTSMRAWVYLPGHERDDDSSATRLNAGAAQ